MQIYLHSLAMIVFMTGWTGCSYLQSKRNVNAPGENVNGSSPKKVTQEQYDDLLRRYDELQNKYEAKESDPNKIETIRIENAQLTEALKGVGTGADAETVDLFKTDDSPAAAASAITAAGLSATDDDIAGDIQTLSAAKALLAKGDLDGAQKSLRSLMESPVRQVQARAYFYTAEIYFSRKQYDLGLQMYEDFTAKFAFSGLTLKALGRMIACSEKMGLKSKQDKYFSILHDFFGST